MLALTGGTPRSGTTWLTNVAQALLRSKGFQFDTVNANSPPEVRRAALSHRIGGNRVVHFHDVIPLVGQMAERRQAAVWFAFRDPGDIVVSQMGLRDIGFEQALYMTNGAMSQLNNALQYPAIRLVPYADICDSPAACVFQVARSLGLAVTADERAEIVTACSFDSKKAEVARIQAGDETVEEQPTPTRTIRANPETLVTDRHIQSGKLGRWRQELTADQQAMVADQFAQFYRIFRGF